MYNASSNEPKPDANFWVVRAGEGGHYASDFEAQGIAAVSFNSVGDVSGMNLTEVAELVASAHVRKEKVPGYAGMLYRFANEIQVGDIIVTPDGATRELLFGEVTGPYEYHERPMLSHFRHLRRVRWLGRCSRNKLPKELLPGLGAPVTLYKVARQDYLLAVLHNLIGSRK